VLKLHGIGASFVRSVNHLKGSVLAAAMICRQFGDDIHRLTHWY
jgi:hypothetical protein